MPEGRLTPDPGTNNVEKNPTNTRGGGEMGIAGID